MEGLADSLMVCSEGSAAAHLARCRKKRKKHEKNGRSAPRYKGEEWVLYDRLEKDPHWPPWIRLERQK